MKSRKTIGWLRSKHPIGCGEYFIDFSGYGMLHWKPAKTRKQHYCTVCGRIISMGYTVYRPVTNKKVRGRRICMECMVEMFDVCPICGQEPSEFECLVCPDETDPDCGYCGGRGYYYECDNCEW